MDAYEKGQTRPDLLYTDGVTNFDNRITPDYDPGHGDKDYARWNTDKVKLLEYMRANKGALKNNKSLLKNVCDLNVITGLSRKFPHYAKYMSLPCQYISNDAHSKTTGPGYSRNNYGKPYFS
jgi:hypothetical protein